MKHISITKEPKFKDFKIGDIIRNSRKTFIVIIVDINDYASCNPTYKTMCLYSATSLVKPGYLVPLSKWDLLDYSSYKIVNI